MTASQWATTATFIEGNYLRVSRGTNLHLAQQAAQMLFYFYLNEESFTDAQAQLSELSDAVIAYNAMKPELYLRQGDSLHAYQAGEDLLLQNVAGVTRVLSILIKNALNDHNPDYAQACLEVGNALTNALQTQDAFLSNAALLIAKAIQSPKLVLKVLTALISQLDQTDTSPVLAHHQSPELPQTMSNEQTIQMALVQFKADPDLNFAMNDPQVEALFKKYEVD